VVATPFHHQADVPDMKNFRSGSGFHSFSVPQSRHELPTGTELRRIIERRQTEVDIETLVDEVLVESFGGNSAGDYGAIITRIVGKDDRQTR
jgi:hypothetical protein